MVQDKNIAVATLGKTMCPLRPNGSHWNVLIPPGFTELFLVDYMYFCSQGFFLEQGRRRTRSATNAMFRVLGPRVVLSTQIPGPPPGEFTGKGNVLQGEGPKHREVKELPDVAERGGVPLGAP